MKPYIVFLLLFCSLSSCYYLQGHQVSKTDYLYCNKLNKDSLRFYPEDRKTELTTVRVLCGLDTVYTEPTGPDIELQIWPHWCSCKFLLDHYQNHPAKKSK